MVNITNDGKSVKFSFQDSIYYLFGDGDIEVSKNSLSLVIDESDMITFKKAASNDLFISVPIDETNFSTKQDVIDFFKNYMVDSGGSPDAFTGVSYDSANQEIVFTNEDDEEVATLDASAFVIDGMVDNVKVENGYLVIDFNTASGKQDIYIPLTSFFDASQYYTKSEVDNTFLTKAVFDIKEEVISDALNQLDEDKVNASDLATVATSGSYNDLSDKPSIPAAQVQANWNESNSSSMAYIQNKPSIPAAQVQANWNESDSSSMAYIQNKPSIPAAQVNSDWNANSGVAQILNKPSIPAAQVQANWNETDSSSMAYIQNKPSIPAAQVQANWNETNSSSMAYIQNKPSIPAAQVNSDWNANSGVAEILNKPNMADYMTVSAFNPKEQAIAEALTELHETIGNINTILSGI